MNKIKTSFALLAQSFRQITQHPKLLLFPLVNFVGLLIIFAFFVLPLFLDTSIFSIGEDFSTFTEQMQAREDRSEQVSFGNVTMGDGDVHFPFLPLAITYMATMFIMTFLNVAFYHEIMQAFNGNAVHISRGLAFACTKLKAILAWSLLAGIVGLIIRKIEENVGFAGRWIMGLLGFSWSVASVFAIPVIIRETQQGNPLAYLKTSAGIIKRTWGEGLVGIASISLTIVLIFMLLVSFSVGLMVAFNTTVLFIIIPIVLCGIIVILGYLSSVLQDVFLCGLYVYATEGVAPGGFDQELLDSAWKIKKK